MGKSLYFCLDNRLIWVCLVRHWTLNNHLGRKWPSERYLLRLSKQRGHRGRRARRQNRGWNALLERKKLQCHYILKKWKGKIAGGPLQQITMFRTGPLWWWSSGQSLNPAEAYLQFFVCKNCRKNKTRMNFKETGNDPIKKLCNTCFKLVQNVSTTEFEISTVT